MKAKDVTEKMTPYREENIKEGIAFLKKRYKWTHENEWTEIAVKALEDYLNLNKEGE